MSTFISKNIKDAIREFGFSKLANMVEAERSGLEADLTTWDGCIQSLAMKIAVNRENEKIVLNGVAAYHRLNEGK